MLLDAIRNGNADEVRSLLAGDIQRVPCDEAIRERHLRIEVDRLVLGVSGEGCSQQQGQRGAHKVLGHGFECLQSEMEVFFHFIQKAELGKETYTNKKS